MLPLLALACAAVFINALLKGGDGAGGALGIAKVSGALLLVAAVVLAYRARGDDSQFKSFKSTFLRDFRYVSMYDKVGRVLLELEYLRLYNAADFATLVRDVDALLRMFNEDAGVLDMARFVDARKAVINSLHMHVNSIPAERVEQFAVSAKRLQALTYAMVKRVARRRRGPGTATLFETPAPYDASDSGFL